MSILDNSNISVHLGKTSQYKSQYDPNLLVREPRSNNRKHLSISDEDLPFIGFDTWNAYEVSALNKNGLPVTAFAKITYSASSKYIVESKSLKLYLNSFNMTYFKSSNYLEIYSSLEYTIAQDLSALLESPVTVKLFDACIQDTNLHSVITDISSYVTLERMTDHVKDVVCDQYVETPDLLEGINTNDSVTTQQYHSSLLKSNCRVTSQPDWGDIYITYRGKYSIVPESLLRYIVSFRDECHFHEEICETIYKRLYDKFQPDELTVTCLYVRRGGIDINPTRSNKIDNIYDVFIDKNVSFVKTTRQ